MCSLVGHVQQLPDVSQWHAGVLQLPGRFPKLGRRSWLGATGFLAQLRGTGQVGGRDIRGVDVDGKLDTGGSSPVMTATRSRAMVSISRRYRA